MNAVADISPPACNGLFDVRRQGHNHFFKNIFNILKMQNRIN